MFIKELINPEYDEKGFFGGNLLSPDRLRGPKELARIAKKGQVFHNSGGRIVGFGKYFAIDVGSNSFLHMHLIITGGAHLPLGVILAGILGGTSR